MGERDLTGDREQFRLRWHRLDKDRIARLETNIQATMTRSVARDGTGWGIVSKLNTSYAAPNLSFGYTELYYCYPDADANVPKGRNLTLDPNRESQASSTVSLAAFISGSTPGLVWAKRAESDLARVRQQVHHPTPGGGEQQQNTATIIEEYCQLAVTGTSLTDPAFPAQRLANGWFPFAYFTWTGATPVVHPIHPADSLAADFSLEGATDANNNLIVVAANHGADEDRALGEFNLIRMLWAMLAMHRRTGVTVDSATGRVALAPGVSLPDLMSPPSRGIDDINDVLDQDQYLRVLYSGILSFNGTSSTYSLLTFFPASDGDEPELTTISQAVTPPEPTYTTAFGAKLRYTGVPAGYVVRSFEAFCNRPNNFSLVSLAQGETTTVKHRSTLPFTSVTDGGIFEVTLFPVGASGNPAFNNETPDGVQALTIHFLIFGNRT